MKETPDLRGKKAEQKPHSPGAPDSDNCAVSGVRVLYVPLMSRLRELSVQLSGPEAKICQPVV